MDNNPSDSSGTDDDLPPAYHNRATRGGHITGNGRAGVIGGLPHNRLSNDMESQIHLLEQEAYSSVLRAFRAQSDSLSWEKASLITELRRELRVSDDEHRELLNSVNADDTVRRIREWREAGGIQSGVHQNIYPLQDQLHSPVSASRKKQKTGQSSFGTPMPTSSLFPKVDISSSGGRGRKPRMGSTLSAEPGKAVSINPLVGRKVMIRWPEDNNFYEAVITDYNPAEGLHALVYDMNTGNETWEWVNLAEIPAEDIRLGGEYPGFSLTAGRGVSGRGMKKGMGRRGGFSGAGRGRGGFRNLPINQLPMVIQNREDASLSNEIKLLSTESLIKEVERIFSSSNSDPNLMEKAKQTLLDHERSLMDIIARLAEASDGESDEGEQSTDKGRGLKDDQQGQDDDDQMIEI